MVLLGVKAEKTPSIVRKTLVGSIVKVGGAFINKPEANYTWLPFRIVSFTKIIGQVRRLLTPSINLRITTVENGRFLMGCNFSCVFLPE